jgi:outer membrane immunogenic protein
MNFKRIIMLAGVAAAAATAQTALAADLPVQRAYTAPAVVAPVSNWTGLYVGGGFGYGLMDVESHTNAAGFVPLATNGDTGGRGWLGRVQIGYDAQLANWVVGIFGDYDWSNIKGTASDQNTGLNFALKQSSAWSVGGRIGYLVVPQFLTYFSGGYTEANFRGSTGVCSFAGCGVAATLPNHTFSGYFLGGGTEYAFSWFGPGWTIKSEYRLAEFSRDTFGVTAPAFPGVTATMRPFVQTITSELTYKFNWGR